MARAGVFSSIVATVLLTVWSLVALPDQVPVHFGLDGAPDRWGSRGELLVLAAVIVVLVGGMSWLAHGIAGTWSLDLVNLPDKDRWLPDHEAALRARVAADLARFAALIGLAMTVLYAGALTASVSVTPLPVWSMVLFVLCLLLGLGGLVGSLLLRYRHPPR
jgi:uncharacterized membrane protein